MSIPWGKFSFGFLLLMLFSVRPGLNAGEPDTAETGRQQIKSAHDAFFADGSDKTFKAWYETASEAYRNFPYDADIARRFAYVAMQYASPAEGLKVLAPLIPEMKSDRNIAWGIWQVINRARKNSVGSGYRSQFYLNGLSNEEAEVIINSQWKFWAGKVIHLESLSPSTKEMILEARNCSAIQAVSPEEEVRGWRTIWDNIYQQDLTAGLGAAIMRRYQPEPGRIQDILMECEERKPETPEPSDRISELPQALMVAKTDPMKALWGLMPFLPVMEERPEIAAGIWQVFTSWEQDGRTRGRWMTLMGETPQKAEAQIRQLRFYWAGKVDSAQVPDHLKELLAADQKASAANSTELLANWISFVKKLYERKIELDIADYFHQLDDGARMAMEVDGKKAEKASRQYPEAKWCENKILITAGLSKAQFTVDEELNLKITFKNESAKDIFLTLYPLPRRTFSYQVYDSETDEIVLQKDHDKTFLGDSSGSRRATPVPAGKSFEYKINLRDLYDLPANKKYHMDIAGNFTDWDTNASRSFIIRNLNFSVKE